MKRQQKKLNSRMAGVKCVLLLVVINFLWSFARGDSEVSCIFMESCILPCSFQAGDEVLIHWVKATAENVHSHYDNEDQLAHQNQRFKGRTSLFGDQISRGNASLRLTGVEVQDQGRYQCYTSTNSVNKESFINLRVDAPVRKVDIQQVENRIICSSDGIYPEPELTWATNPPSNMILQSTTEVQLTEQQLYSVSRSLMLSDSVTDLVYICTVSTRRNSRRASLFKPTSMNGSSSETTISCASSNIPLTSLIWRFNHSQTILTQTGADVPYTASAEWSQRVKGVSKTGNLTLKGLSSKHDGTYTCELSNAEETYITNTSLRIIEDSSTNVAGIAGGLVGAFLCVVLIGLAVYWAVNRTKTRDPQNTGPNGVSNPPEEIPLNMIGNRGG